MALNIILDIILVGILLAGMVIGALKGFIKVVTKPLRPLLTFSISFYAAPPIGEKLIAPLICEPLTNQISSFLHENCAAITAESVEKLPTLVKLAAALAGVDLPTLSDDADGIIASVVEALALPIVNIIATIVAFAILFIVFRFLLSLLFSVANNVFGRGVFGVFNRILGCLASGLLAVFIAWGFVSLFEYVVHFPGIVDAPIFAEFTGGSVYAFFKQYNPVELLLSF